jgi:hypothetical protein
MPSREMGVAKGGIFSDTAGCVLMEIIQKGRIRGILPEGDSRRKLFKGEEVGRTGGRGRPYTRDGKPTAN